MTWLTNHLGLTGIKLAADNGNIGGYVLPGDLIPSASGQLLGGSGSAGQAVGVSLGSNFSLSGGVLSYTLPLASASSRGVVQVDGTTITISNGVISSVGGGGGTGSGAVGSGSLNQLGYYAGAGTTISGLTLGTGLSITTGTLNVAVPSGASSAPAMDGSASAGTATTFARADHVHPNDTSRLAVASNLSDLNSAPTARTNLGLGTVATLASTAVALTANNLSDLASAATARTNLGLGNAAVLGGTAQGQVAYYTGTAWAVLAPGTSGYVLTTNGTGANPTWTAPTGGSSGFGTPTTITASGAVTISLATTKTFYKLSNTSGVTTLTLPNGTTDGQEFLLEVLPTTQAHTIAGTFYEASETLACSSPNEGYSLNAIWNTALTSWVPRSRDGGYKIGDLSAASSVAGTDLLEVSQSGSNRNATATKLGAFVLGSTNVAAVSGGGTSNFLRADGTWAAAGGLTLNSRPALSTLTWLNQGTSTANEISGGPIVLTFPTAGSGSAIGLEQTPPSAPYTFTGRQVLTYPFHDTMTAGVFVRNSSTGSFTTVTQDYCKTSPGQSIGVYRYSGSGATFGSVLKSFDTVPGRVEFLRIINDGTNITYLCSMDGYAWVTMYSETVSSAGSPDRMGQYALPYDSSTLNIAALLTIREWAVLSSASPQATANTAGV